MGFFLIIVFAISLGYAASESGRYIAAQRSENILVVYSRKKLGRRLWISGLLMGEVILIATRLYGVVGEVSLAFIIGFLTLSMGALIGIFVLLILDLRETRRGAKEVHERLKEELLRKL